MKHTVNRIKAVKLQCIKQQQGAVLLEALIAILIFSFGILAISGLQAAMLKNTTDSNYRAEASYIVQQQVGFMWADPATYVCPAASGAAAAACYQGGNINLSARLPNGNLAVTRTVGNTFQFVLTWQTPGESAHNYTANASIDANL